MRGIQSKAKARAVAKAAAAKKAIDITILDLRAFPTICDYFVIASGSSTTQVGAIADNIIERMKDKKERLWHREGHREALWVLLDYSDVVAHVFYDETRRFYDLERLWSDAPRVSFKEVKKKRVIPHARKSRKT